MTRTRHFRFLLAAADSVCALVLVALAVMWTDQPHVRQAGLAQFFAIRITLLNVCLATIFAFTWMKCWDSLGLYKRDGSSVPSLLLRTLAGTTSMTLMLAVFLKLRYTSLPISAAVARFFAAAFVLETCRILLSNRSVEGKFGEPERVIILGTGRRAGSAWRELRTRHHGAKHFLGFFDNRDPSALAPDISAQYLGCIDELPEYLLRHVVDELIIATPLRSCYDLTQRAISLADAAGVRVTYLSDVFNISSGAGVQRSTAMFHRLAPKDEAHERAEILKRGLDIVAAGLGLVLLAPVFLLIGIVVKLTSPGPVFFAQERYGYGRRRFRMYKFRSMVQNAAELLHTLEEQNEADGPIFKMKNDPRVTRFGSFIRSTSLDELPQLWNVLIGDMSLVGPRPMSVRDVSLFSEAQLMRRFSVRPGITGSWQVSGRSSLSFEQWIALDFSYIDEWSLGLDFKILALTVPAVLKRHGAI